MPIPNKTSSFTLTYSESSQGWPSFYTFFPEFIKGMNAYLYSFKNGNLYSHNTNETRNNYYDIQGISTITSAFNPRPTLDIKLFKTLSFESNASWTCTSLLTDLSQGSIAELFFEQKEGEWFSYVRHNAGVTNFALRYANGLGTILAPTGGTAAALELTVTSIGDIASIGATVYTLVDGGNPVLAGIIVGLNKQQNIVTVDTTGAGVTAPVAGNFLMFVNNTLAESYGMRGYYMEFTLTNDDTTEVEMFAVGSSVMKSYP
tara:strand:- start:602 stop:1381 length:780 start_codon:yes stop_codon:yes gene_type:complete